MNPQDLKSTIGSGLLSFPLTDFDSEGNFNERGYRARLDWLAPYGATALFAAGGTGEFFSLTADEHPPIIRAAVYMKMGDRFAYLGGLPTAEVYAAAYKALGTPVYSSAVFNFIPKTALQFYEAVRTDDMATQHHLLREFFMPYLEIRNRGAGYA